MSVYPSFDFAPYAQLLRTLMPRARGIYLYAPDADLIWSADGADLQDLRPVVLELLESARDSASIAGTREVLEDMPAYGFVLRDERSGVLGVLAIVCRSGGRDAELPAFEAVERLLAPLLTVARRDLAQQRVLDTGRFNVEDTQELQWLFDMSQAEVPAGAGDSLQLLMDAFAARAGCDVALLHVPTRRLERVAPRCILQPTELDTLRGLVSRHLLRVAQLQQKTLIVNKVPDSMRATDSPGPGAGSRSRLQPQRQPAVRGARGAHARATDATPARSDRHLLRQHDRPADTACIRRARREPTAASAAGRPLAGARRH
ncbi:MAG: hypothetical protein NTZ79_12965 [Proteobacteria bacterium]|nr:hypothetical protein [Pseudomonadota bacterium]